MKTTKTYCKWWQESRSIAGSTARCLRKFWCVSNFT